MPHPTKMIYPAASSASPIGFTASQCVALLDAIARHDTVDLAAELPPVVSLDYDSALLERCYRISLQLWQDVEHGTLARLAMRLARGGSFEPAEARAFKDIRARAKQLRFAYATLDASHVYPAWLDRVTRMMGQAQDALRTGHRMKSAIRAIGLMWLMSRWGSAASPRECARFTVDDPDGLRAYIRCEIERIGLAVSQPAITNKVFHETRKIVSRLVAFYDSLVILAPSDDHRAIDRYLSTINGLMGAMHDDMVEQKAGSRQSYHRNAEPLPPEIAGRLGHLVDAFRPALTTRRTHI